MTEVLTTHTDDQATERLGAGTVVTDYAGDAVVLRTTSDGDVELCRSDGAIRTQAISTSLVRQYDPARQQQALHRAVTTLDAERRRLATGARHDAGRDPVGGHRPVRR